MTWRQVRADQLSEGDHVLWGAARAVQSVAGNVDRIEVTFTDDTPPATLGRAAMVWKNENEGA